MCPVSKVAAIERRIQRVEGFRVRILYEDGRDVRGDRSDLHQYPYERMMRNSANVREWIDSRFRSTYQGFDAKVVDAHDRKVHGNTLLGTVRDTYLD
jgi:hypothetical protein